MLRTNLSYVAGKFVEYFNKWEVAGKKKKGIWGNLGDPDLAERAKACALTPGLKTEQCKGKVAHSAVGWINVHLTAWDLCAQLCWDLSPSFPWHSRAGAETLIQPETCFVSLPVCRGWFFSPPAPCVAFALPPVSLPQHIPADRTTGTMRWAQKGFTTKEKGSR